MGDLRQRVQHDADVLARIEERLRRQTHPFSQDPTALKRAIADGVARGLFAYAAPDAQDRFSDNALCSAGDPCRHLPCRSA